MRSSEDNVARHPRDKAARRGRPAKLTARAYAPNTRAAYRAGWKRLESASLTLDTLDDAGLAMALTALDARGLAPATVALAASAAAKLADEAGRPSPKGPLTAKALKVIRRRSQGRGRGQAAPVTWRDADSSAVLAASGNGVGGLRDAAIIAVMSDGLLRVSECAALRAGDVSAEADGSGRLAMRRSTAGQEGDGAVLFLGRPTMERIAAWQSAARIDPAAESAEPLFRRVRKGGHVQPQGLSPLSVHHIVKARAKAAGAAGRVSGHSLRVGSAVSMVRRGATVSEACQAGRWKSGRMVNRYAAGEIAGRGAVARLRYES